MTEPELNILDYPCTDVGNAELFLALNPLLVYRWVSETHDNPADFYWTKTCAKNQLKFISPPDILRLAVASVRYRANQADVLLKSMDEMSVEQRRTLDERAYMNKGWAEECETYDRLNALIEIAKALASKEESENG